MEAHRAMLQPTSPGALEDPGGGGVHKPGRLLSSSRTSTVTDNAEQHPLLETKFGCLFIVAR